LTIIKTWGWTGALTPCGASLVKNIMKLLERNWVVEITHFYKKVNWCADVLLNISCNSNYLLTIHESCPLQHSVKLYFNVMRLVDYYSLNDCCVVLYFLNFGPLYNKKRH
jgi:hypothetical protein